jgi:hypothetical protein
VTAEDACLNRPELWLRGRARTCSA